MSATYRSSPDASTEMTCHYPRKGGHFKVSPPKVAGFRIVGR